MNKKNSNSKIITSKQKTKIFELPTNRKAQMNMTVKIILVVAIILITLLIISKTLPIAKDAISKFFGKF